MSLSMPENKQVREIAEEFSSSTKGKREPPVRFLTTGGGDGILQTKGRRCDGGSPNSIRYQFTLTAWIAAERSARFYGQYVGHKGQAHQKPQKLLSEVSHPAPPPFSKGKWLTAESQRRLTSRIANPAEACQQTGPGGVSFCQTTGIRIPFSYAAPGT